jgi:fatty-acyl-CoA synthase
VAVIGRQDSKWGERPLALVIPREGVEPPTPRQIIRHLSHFIEKGLLSKQAMLLKMKLVDTIDKTSVGKIDKKNLRIKHLP